MKLTFSTTGKSFTPGNSSVPEEDCFAALDVDHARRVSTSGPISESKQVTVDLNTEQAQALVEQLLRDYPYLRPTMDPEYVRSGIRQDLERYGHVAAWREAIYHETHAADLAAEEARA
jgi:hypothetical protein